MMLLVAFLLSAGTLIFVMNGVVTTNFQRIENDAVLSDVARARSALDEQTAEVVASAKALATVASGRQRLGGPSEFDLDFYLLTSSSNKAATPTFVDSTAEGTSSDAQAVSALQKLVSPSASSPPGGTQGVILLPKGPAIVAVSDIASTGDQAGSRVVAGRYLGPTQAARIGRLVYQRVVLGDPRTRSALPVPAGAYSAVNPSQSGVAPVSSSQTVGWGNVAGLGGDTALVIALIEDRTITEQAAATLAYVRWGLVLLSLLVGLSIIAMLEGSVLNRIDRLRDSVIDFADGAASLDPVAAKGGDEIADLALALNTTLGRMKASEEAHKHDAQHDHLTGLANRRYLAENAPQLLHQCTNCGKSCTLVLLDLDGFKSINDELGHQIGDDVLVWFANHMRATLRSDGIMCRLGGDEFAVFMPHTTREEAEVAIGRLRRTISQPEDDPCLGMHEVSFSVGYAVYPDHGETLEMLMQCGDTDLYANKRGKADDFVVAPEAV
jgi:diguanylate cyclase (GGDEF)-like protein